MSMIGDNVRRKREIKKISQNKLAKLAGIAQPTLSAIENSTKSPTIDTVIMLADALECSVSSLISEESDGDTLTSQEYKIIQDFRLLNQQGKEYVLQSLAMAVQLYISGESISATNLENAQ